MLPLPDITKSPSAFLDTDGGELTVILPVQETRTDLEVAISIAARVEPKYLYGVNRSRTYSPITDGPSTSEADRRFLRQFLEAMTVSDIEGVMEVLRHAKPGDIDLGFRNWIWDEWDVAGAGVILTEALSLRPVQTLAVLNDAMDDEGCRTVILECCGDCYRNEVIEWVAPFVNEGSKLNPRALSGLVKSLIPENWNTLSPGQTHRIRTSLLRLRLHAEHVDPKVVASIDEYLGEMPA